MSSYLMQKATAGIYKGWTEELFLLTGKKGAESRGWSSIKPFVFTLFFSFCPS